MSEFEQAAKKHYILDYACLKEEGEKGEGSQLEEDGEESLTQILLFSYRPRSLADPPRPAADGALWSAISRGQDYHQLVRGHAQAYGEEIRQLFLEKRTDLADQLTFTVQVDTEPVSERDLAVRAGLGWIGRNQNLIHPVYGSYVLIACLRWWGEERILQRLQQALEEARLGKEQRGKERQEKVKPGASASKLMEGRSAELEIIGPAAFAEEMKKDREESSTQDPCASCHACQLICPGGALYGERGYNIKRCLSYISQKKGFLSEEESRLLGRHLYGCDLCQQVCPWNRQLEKRGIDLPVDPRLLGETEAVWTSCLSFLQAPNRDLEKCFGDRSGCWRGWTQLRKNALLALWQSCQEEESLRAEALPLFRQYAVHPSPVLQATAKFILRQIQLEEI